MAKSDREIIEEIHGDVADIKQVLKGYDGQNGLVRQVSRNTREISKLWIAVAVLIATVGSSGYGIIKLLVR